MADSLAQPRLRRHGARVDWQVNIDYPDPKRSKTLTVECLGADVGKINTRIVDGVNFKI